GATPRPRVFDRTTLASVRFSPGAGDDRKAVEFAHHLFVPPADKYGYQISDHDLDAASLHDLLSRHRHFRIVIVGDPLLSQPVFLHRHRGRRLYVSYRVDLAVRWSHDADPRNSRDLYRQYLHGDQAAPLYDRPADLSRAKCGHRGGA